MGWDDRTGWDRVGRNGTGWEGMTEQDGKG